MLKNADIHTGLPFTCMVCGEKDDQVTRHVFADTSPDDPRLYYNGLSFHLVCLNKAVDEARKERYGSL